MSFWNFSFDVADGLMEVIINLVCNILLIDCEYPLLIRMALLWARDYLIIDCNAGDIKWRICG